MTTTSYRRLRGLLACAVVMSACSTSSDPSGDAQRHRGAPDAQTAGANTANSGGVAVREPKLPVAHDGRLDLSGGPWRMIEVPAASNAPTIVRTPDGWLALSNRTSGSGKAITGSESVLYRSDDGVTWDRIALEGGDNLGLVTIAYGKGRYVMVGRNHSEAVIWVSDDAKNWTETLQNQDLAREWGQVAFVGGRFIAFGFRVLGVSDDGSSWNKVTVDLVQMMGVAHGNGRFVMTGSGPVITSDDGLHWQSRTIDCSLPDTCITDPSGVSHEAILASVVFAENQFFAGKLATPDGVTWSVASELAPSAHIDGHFLSLAGNTLSTWTLGETPEVIPTVRPSKAAATAMGRELTSVGVLDHDAPLPDHVSVGFDDGLSCATSTSVLVDGRLFLVPPPGTPPLPDRTPRGADGNPLLSDQCPVSRMIFCSDYEARTNCFCRPNAPRGPSFCGDVSQFTCEGVFVHRPDEWKIDDIAEGGCSCDGLDPNQPPTFGRSCEADANGAPSANQARCQAPLMCLPVQPPASAGLPQPEPLICTAPCHNDVDCPSWQATGFCSGEVRLRCANQTCQPRTCDQSSD